jgi:excisionase family DNA binding protein
MGSTAQKVAWSLQEASDAVAISVPTLRRHMKSGRLRGTKIGRRMVILDGDLHRFVRGGESHAEPQPVSAA